MIVDIFNEEKMKRFGEILGSNLVGGSVIELIGDVGSGKTTLVKGIAIGLGIEEHVQSPSFTIKRLYDARDQLVLVHYDFYRLIDAGIMKDELVESISNESFVNIIEWGDIVEGVLPNDRLSIKILTISENSRELNLYASGAKSQKLLDLISL